MQKRSNRSLTSTLTPEFPDRRYKKGKAWVMDYATRELGTNAPTVETMLRILNACISEATRLRPNYDSTSYAIAFENDIFSMVPYCWCEQDECPWCSEGAPNFLHKPSGATVHWYKRIGRGMKVSKGNWHEIFAECFASLDQVQPVCRPSRSTSGW